MAFDVAVWDTERPPTVTQVEQRYQQLSKGQDGASAPSPRITAFLEECGRRWPPATDEADQALTTKRTAAGLIVALDPQTASARYIELGEMAECHGLVLYDPQSGMIRIPSRLSFDADPPRSSGKGRIRLRRRR